MKHHIAETQLIKMQSRRQFLALGASCVWSFNTAGAVGTVTAAPLNFGLTPVLLTNDLELLTKLNAYLSRKTGREVQLVQRRTYEEITALLLSGQLDGAWICGYPFAQFRAQLSLIVTAFASKGQSAKSVELVGCAVASNAALGPPRRLFGGALRVKSMAFDAETSRIRQSGNESAATFAGIWI